jgi:hypothetical protein
VNRRIELTDLRDAEVLGLSHEEKRGKQNDRLLWNLPDFEELVTQKLEPMKTEVLIISAVSSLPMGTYAFVELFYTAPMLCARMLRTSPQHHL